MSDEVEPITCAVDEDDVVELCSEGDREQQKQWDEERERMVEEMEDRKKKAEERRRKMQRKLKGLGLRWKQIAQKRLDREKSYLESQRTENEVPISS